MNQFVSIAIFGLFSLGVQSLSASPLRKEWDLRTSWIVSASQAHAILGSGGQLLDARDMTTRFLPLVSGAKVVSWEDWSESKEPNQGKLLVRKLLLKKMESQGIDLNKPIIVLGDPLKGWGEEGRIVWSLRALGHKTSYLVDGGARSFLEVSKEKSALNSIDAAFLQKSAFDLRTNDTLSNVNIEKEKINPDEQIVLDVREEREFKGETPYGERRGGHIPGAKWIYFKSFVQPSGFFKSKDEILGMLSLASSNKKTIVSYCTGGVRSAFSTALLVSYGLDSKNYSGSMWEWSASDSKQYPLAVK